MKDYLLYPDVMSKLNNSGLVEKIDYLLKEDNNPLNAIGFLFEEDLKYYQQQMKFKGYFSSWTDELKRKLNQMFEAYEKFYWTIEKEKKVKEKIELEDLLLFMGYYTSFILSPQEISKPEKFQFTNIIELNGSIGAYMISKNSKPPKGYSWISNALNKTFRNYIGGTDNYDLIINQEDITQYKTLDPFANLISYRPKLSDSYGIFAADSTEADFLIILLKYSSQEKIKSEFLYKDKIISFLANSGNSSNFFGEGCAEHFTGLEKSTEKLFRCWDRPIPKLDSEYLTRESSSEIILTRTIKQYYVFVGPNKELIFSQTYENNKKEISAIFMPNDLDDLFKGLFLQAQLQLGRTPLIALLDILDYSNRK